MVMTQADENRHDFAFIAGAVVGAIAGALVTLALTPMSGPDTREKLRSRANELGPIRERALEAAGPVRERAGTFAMTASERAQSLAATGKERAADLAARTPIGRGGQDENGMAPAEANEMLSGHDPNAHPGGTVTPGALASAAADDTDMSHQTAAQGSSAPVSSATPERSTPSSTVSGPSSDPTAVHTQDPAEGQRDQATESGNGRVSEEPRS